ncbi:hypothetical protein L2E82_36067 [Cichorium intybus]|uniref:Uncharacterized protein n=1 Tax=Cichorium intybus TaxID=13427 RepID=A0ACB9BQL6_CICIN|nr:hypothetical protein L2E82_36067 [Cichorium intybus]
MKGMELTVLHVATVWQGLLKSSGRMQLAASPVTDSDTVPPTPSPFLHDVSCSIIDLERLPPLLGFFVSDVVSIDNHSDDDQCFEIQILAKLRHNINSS